MLTINTVAALKRLPVGTKLYLVRAPRMPDAPAGRVVVKARSAALVLRADEPGAKHHGAETELWLVSGTKVEATPYGFTCQHPAGLLCEYVFDDRLAAWQAAQTKGVTP